MSNLKKTEAEVFKRWFSSQKKYASLSAMERALNITKGYLHQIRDGTRRATNPELRRKLQEATGLRAFDPVTNGSRTSVNMAESITKTRVSETSNLQKEEELPESLPILLDSAIKKLGLTLSACSQKYKIKLDTLKKYKSGVRRPASKNNISALFNILNDAEAIPSSEDSHTKVKIARTSSTAEEKSRTVMRLLISLSEELGFFKNCTEDERRIFRKTVPGQDVGYITTLLRALYDEDRFQKWLFFSTYTMKGKYGGE